MYPSLFAGALALLPAAQAMFILSHGSLTTDRLDPIVNPGAVAGHVHAVVGSNAFAPAVTYEDLQKATCTTAPPQADKSNYWVPQLYYKDAGKYTAIPVDFVNTYYLNRDGPTQKKITAFPNGLRMLAGSPYRTTYNASSHADTAINYVCLNYKGDSTGPTPEFPEKGCPNGLRAQVMFPGCWDGKNLDSEDHKSHLSYPIQSHEGGDCPATHPVKLPTLFYEFVFATYKFPGFGKDHWVFSSGNAAYSFHGDFISGWDRNVLQAAMDQCTGLLFGDLEKCPPLVPSLDRAKAGKCKLDPVVEEDVGFTKALVKLPGCNPVPGGSSAAKCVGLATPAIKGLKPASPASPDSSASASSISSSAAATDSSAAATSTSSSAAAVKTSSADASPATSTVPTASASSSPAASVSLSSHINVGAIKTPLPVPTKASTCKRSNREAAALAAASKHKRAVHHHARRNLNRASF